MYRLIGLASLLAFATQANVDTFLSNQSYTGLVFTPNAQTTPFGTLAYSFGHGVPTDEEDLRYGEVGDVDNWLFNGGMTHWAEATGRIVTETYDVNLYQEPGGIRDLSISLKFNVPIIKQYTGVDLAFGFQDIEGAANNYETQFVVADTEFVLSEKGFPGAIRVSAGYGKSTLTGGIMEGAFGGFEWQPIEGIQLVAEHDSTEVNTAIRVVTPDGFLPAGAKLGAQYVPWTGHGETTDIWNLNASVPAFGMQLTHTPIDVNTKISLEDKLDIALTQYKDPTISDLVNALVNEGFIDVQVGQKQSDHDDVLIVRLENRRYFHNQIDGLGVAMGIIASLGPLKLSDGEQPSEFEVVMHVNGLPVISAQTEYACYREYLATDISCSDLQFSTQGLNKELTASQWYNAAANGGLGKAQLIFSPSIYYGLATEYGFFDYSLALSSNLYFPLWKGAAVDVRHLLPLSNSDDYDEGGRFSSDLHENEVDRILLHQTFTTDFNLRTQFSAGRMYGDYTGVLNESVWFSPKGYHNLGFQIARLEPDTRYTDDGKYRDDIEPLLYYYSLHVPEYAWELQGEYGEFWSGDEGFSVTSRHWLGDVQLAARYLNTEDEEYMSLAFQLPITPWREMKPDVVQVRGIDQFEFMVQTRINNDINYLNYGLGNSILLQNNLKRRYNNRGRQGVNYYYENAQRLRNAYLRYLEITS
uniref:YjbH domain-containing protein n=1 Tax=Thaumasiovibrio occultus TaxID=1891184 RepID=UPI000B3546F6|nr:YjbH domain-containing protein [Thaumasiovibrio occultus]